MRHCPPLRVATIALLLPLAACAPEEEPAATEAVSGAVTISSTSIYNLVGVQSGKCVDLPGGSTATGTRLDIATCNGKAQQQFRMEATDSGYYRLRNVNSNLCVDVSGASTTSGASVIQWTCGTGYNQQWSFTDVSGGAERLTVRHSGQVLDVTGNATADGTPLEQWPSNGGTNQQFKLQAAGSGGTGSGGSSGGSIPPPAGCAWPAPAGSPVARHGQLRVAGNKLVDQSGAPYQLRGLSSFWLNWENTQYAESRSATQFMRDNWKLQVLRAAMGTEASGGYLSNPSGMQARIDAIVGNALALGTYVIVDWHTEKAVNQQSQAVSFFTALAKKYGACPNIIYEDYNEPNGFTWSQIKPYHQAVVNAIRSVDSDNLIVLGTPTWSQDVDIASQSPVSGTNLLYTLHFYSCSHGQSLRDKGNTALSRGLALFVTEFGATPADGGVPPNNKVCESEANNWFSWMGQNDISGAAWKLIPGADSSNILTSAAPVNGPWPDSDLTTTSGSPFGHGLFVVNWVRQ